ncbi:Oidioi.mRNA.OKI2018_I69.PAR.g11840.t1.cds [Oikopleura dioica]|uniref:Oidioi.mRNA.OKI2018_I69.PAR.g11840.t1.cds n=1 Tax=Oikopleura dioica TaxID=34765 RepID=A0ABN7S387_OIKDI|nr:Oidioi.mRNA.OKI2018_I69.PAR.g11840.t1.cds [Oikopleura dioica]
MKILPSTLASLSLAAAPGWLAASRGGYSSASCKCEIKCTPDIQRETCAADIVAAIDMQYFTEQKEKSAAEFLSRLENEISTTLGYGSNRQAARFAVFGFSSENDEIQTGLSFLDSVDELKASDIPDKIENIFKSGTINKWAFENDDEQDLGVGIERALDFFKEPHLPAVEEERDDLGFEPTRLLLVLSDGAKKKKSSSLLKAIEAAHENNIKIGAVTLTQMDSPACRRGYVMCPDVEHLTSLSDFVVDGSRAGSAARDVFDFVGQKECYHNGGCKPCNCECDLPRGPAGEEGALGCDGAQGPCGDSGNPGKDGVDGPAGPPGPRGTPGPCGPCGRPGLPGTGGEIGPDGGDGMDGNPGVVGLQGPTGPPGEQGDAGIRGYSGVHGNQGRNGPDGKQGEKGEKGQPDKEPWINGGQGCAIFRFLLDQFLEEHGFQTEQWKAYLTSYYSDEVVSTLSTSIREIVVEWMNENMDVINCMLNCGSADCGGGSGNSAGKGGGITVKPLECEEPVDVVFMVDGSDSVSSRDWPKVLTWVTNLVDQISPADREKSSTIVFQDFSMNPATGAIPQEIMGRFDPGDQGSVDDFKAAVLAAKQSGTTPNDFLP